MTKTIIKVIFSLSAGLGLAVLVMLITGLVATWLGADDNDIPAFIGLVEGTLAFSIFSFWLYGQLRK